MMLEFFMFSGLNYKCRIDLLETRRLGLLNKRNLLLQNIAGRRLGLSIRGVA